MKRIVRLTESELIKVVKKVLKEGLLTEAVSPAGSYKSRVGDMIVTISFVINGSTLMMNMNGKLVCQWTINPAAANDMTRKVLNFIPKLGPAGGKLFNAQGQMIASPSTADNGQYGLDKSMLAALTETFDAQPTNSPWKQLRKATNNTYEESMKSRFTTWTSKLSDSGVANSFSVSSQVSFTGLDKQTYKIQPTAYYRIDSKSFIIYITAPATIRTPEGGIPDASLQTAIQKTVKSLRNQNSAIISEATQSQILQEMIKQIVPKMDALVKQL
jgi:hypothetical protein